MKNHLGWAIEDGKKYFEQKNIVSVGLLTVHAIEMHIILMGLHITIYSERIQTSPHGSAYKTGPSLVPRQVFD